jgi:hypothetical protein
MDALFVMGQIVSILFLCVGCAICIIEGLKTNLDSERQKP